jgi:uncharacterized protein YbjT (DUF2867 family)
MKILIFGATGMVGQGVLRECLADSSIGSVVIIGRNSTGITDSKIDERIVGDMFDYHAAGDLSGVDSCFFCLGVSAAGMNEKDYTRLTYDLTTGWANSLAGVSPDLTFIYVSGAGTGGRAMWAQVKGRTEDALLKLFPSAYMIRLGALQPMHGEVSKTSWTRIGYKVLWPLLPLLRVVWPGSVITTEELGRAMIRLAKVGSDKRILENRDVVELGRVDQARANSPV